MRTAKWNQIDEEILMERYDLITERIKEISEEQQVPTQYRAFFKWGADFLMQTFRLLALKKEDQIKNRSLEACKEDQESLFAHIKTEHYAESFANPDYAVSMLGEEAGHIITLLCSELEAAIGYAFAGKQYELTVLAELFVGIYNCFESDDLKEAKDTIYWFFHDYSELFIENQVREMVVADDGFPMEILRNADLTDPRYLYSYGTYIGKNELEISAFLNSMPEADVQAMADTYTEGYRIGFVHLGVDLSKKDTVQIHYPIGFERMMRLAVANFEKLGLQVTAGMEPMTSCRGKGNAKRNVYGTDLNKQYYFDHREDKAFYFDKAFVERRLEVLKTMFEHYKKEAAGHAGPAVVEVFGEAPFAPEHKDSAIHNEEKQQKLNVYNSSESSRITYEYINGEERSFTIIAYPIPEIGAQFAEIFAETVKINTLDYVSYQTMQQKLIDVLDQAKEVHVKGAGKNRTDLTVSIWPLADPEKETAFENCVADVNIPVGEVFTSPVLKGTTGVLHVSEVFLNGLQFLDLELHFEDGMVTSYSCGNFEKEEDNLKYIKDHILAHHDTLPMGEFAIGTNTTAYRMGQKYQIQDKLPILIAEKTGPHFAVGDTCYSQSEDVVVYNPNGKEIVAKENDFSRLRNEDRSKAYFNQHLDITIPYDELDSIIVVQGDGAFVPIIENGLFVVEGTEALNEPLLQN